MVEPDEAQGGTSFLCWNSGGNPHEKLAQLIEEDGGRYALIVDFTLTALAKDAQTEFSALDRAGEELDIAVEGCFGPKKGKPGRAYLAAPYAMKPPEVMIRLRSKHLPLILTLVHSVDDE
jgi:hypothetical protein